MKITLALSAVSMLLTGAAFAQGPQLITKPPLDSGSRLANVGAAVRSADGKIHVSLAVPAASIHTSGKLHGMVWYPTSYAAATGNGPWAGMTLSAKRETGGMKIYEGTFKEGQNGFTTSAANRSGVAVGLVGNADPQGNRDAFWGQPIGQNVYPQIAPTAADREYLKSMGITPRF